MVLLQWFLRVDHGTLFLLFLKPNYYDAMLWGGLRMSQLVLFCTGKTQCTEIILGPRSLQAVGPVSALPFFFHLPLIYYVCSTYFIKADASGPAVRRPCSEWWDGLIFFSCIPLPVLQIHTAFCVCHEASPGAGGTLTWWAMCRTLADELRRGRNPLWGDAIPIYPPSTEDQPFRKPSRSRHNPSLPSCLGAGISMEVGRESRETSLSTAHL